MSAAVLYYIGKVALAWFLGYGFGLLLRVFRQFTEKAAS